MSILAPRNIRVVLIDDEPAQNLLWGSILRSAGYSVTCCLDAASGLTEVGKGCDCFITDYQMPDTDGIEVIRRTRGRTPVCIMLTGVESAEVHRQALAAGADYVITKPTQPGVVLAALARLCQVAFAQKRHATERPLLRAHGGTGLWATPDLL